MTITAHNVLILSLVVVCLAPAWRFLSRCGTNSVHDSRQAKLLGGILAIVSSLSAATYDGNQFGMVQLVAWSALTRRGCVSSVALNG
jgi:hypothetical protein